MYIDQNQLQNDLQLVTSNKGLPFSFNSRVSIHSKSLWNATNPDCGEVCSLSADKVPLLPTSTVDAVGVPQIVHLEEPQSFNIVWKNNRLFRYGKMSLQLSKSSSLASWLYFWPRESLTVASSLYIKLRQVSNQGENERDFFMATQTEGHAKVESLLKNEHL